jgi:hypothetical protein
MMPPETRSSSSEFSSTERGITIIAIPSPACWPAELQAIKNYYAMVVNGRFKTQFEEQAAAKAATELLTRYPMLQIEIYDAASRRRMPVR